MLPLASARIASAPAKLMLTTASREWVSAEAVSCVSDCKGHYLADMLAASGRESGLGTGELAAWAKLAWRLGLVSEEGLLGLIACGEVRRS